MAEKVREEIDAFFASLPPRIAEIKQRCQRELQALAGNVVYQIRPKDEAKLKVDFTLRSV
jgi:hypothetical protein